MTGRPRDTFLYQQFSEPYVPADMKSKTVSCIHCEKQNISAQASRMRLHLSRCEHFKAEIGQEEFSKFMKKNDFQSSSKVNENFSGFFTRNLSSEQSIEPPRKRPITIDSFMDKMSDTEKAEIDYLYAKFVHLSCPTFYPFSDSSGKAFLEMLRPAYVAKGGIPSPDRVAGELLTRHHNDVMKEVKSIITKSLGICLTQDKRAYVNANGFTVRNIMCCCPFPFVVGTVHNIETTDEAPNNLVEKCKTMVQKCLGMFKDAQAPAPGLVGFCTNNLNVNKSLRAELMKDQNMINSGLVAYGCSCDALNNFGKDVCKLGLFEVLFKKVKAIAAVFHDVKFAQTHQNAKKMEEYKCAYNILRKSETRWTSNLALLLCTMSSKDALLAINLEYKNDGLNLHREVSGKNNEAGLSFEEQNISDILDSTTFWNMLEQGITLLKPIAFAIKILEDDQTPISMVAMTFIMLMRFFDNASKMHKFGFYFTDIGLTPADFRDTKQNSTTTLPGLLRQRWNEMTSHSVSPSSPGPASGLFHLALWLDQGTKPMILKCLIENNNCSLDASRSLMDSLNDGALYLSKLIEKNRPHSYYKFEEFIWNLNDIMIEEFDKAMCQGGRNEHPAINPQHPLNNVTSLTGPRMIMVKYLFTLPASAIGQCGKTHLSKKNQLLQSDKVDYLAKVKLNRKAVDRASKGLKDVRSKSVLELFYLRDMRDFREACELPKIDETWFNKYE